tara:strand:- start:3588 stop:3707 length:120 start_codon:yes stop_codon:yes gene_type:complete
MRRFRKEISRIVPFAGCKLLPNECKKAPPYGRGLSKILS